MTYSKLLLALILLFGMTPSSMAGLGGDSASIERDRQAFHGKKTITIHDLYQTHEITTDAQTVREYISSDGNVFAVTWKGGVPPNLSQLFGAYFQEFTQAESSSAKTKGRSPKTIKSTNMVVEKFGHMRDLHGKAYITKLLPQGLDPKEIQ